VIRTHFLISREKFPHRYRRAGDSHYHAASKQNANSDLRDRSPADRHYACSPFPFSVRSPRRDTRFTPTGAITRAVTGAIAAFTIDVKQSITSSFSTQDRATIDRLVYTEPRSRLPLRFMLSRVVQWRPRASERPHFVHLSGFRTHVSMRRQSPWDPESIYAL